MGIFGKRSAGDEAILSSLLITFGQSIKWIEQQNQIVLKEAWDIFVNTVGLLGDSRMISEFAMDVILAKSGFPDNHELTLDLLKIRSRGGEADSFVDIHKKSLITLYAPKEIRSKSDWHPKDFSGTLNQIASGTYPSFGSTQEDQVFSATLGLYMVTLVTDLNNINSNLSDAVNTRIVGYEFALRWLSEWNLAK
jgi:hypothetical protein